MSSKQTLHIFGGRRKGNVIADLFGLDEIGSPVAGEVKMTHKGPWYATVECAAQVVLMRGDRKGLRKYLRGKLGEKLRAKGAWGIVVAPPKYYERKQAELTKVKKLIERLQKNTEVRICCVSFEPSAADGEVVSLRVECGRPPLTRIPK